METSNPIQTIQKSTPRDFFMYLLNIGTLYFVVAGILILFFQYINVAFPDKLNPYYDAGDPIRWALALVIIIFPVFFWVSRVLMNDLAVNPAKGEFRIRRWLLYFTLFVAAVAIIGDLVMLLFNFFQGDLTARFLLKVLAVLMVAAAVFGYYLYDLRRGPGEFSPKAKFFVWAVIAVIFLSVVYGFYTAGSPFKQRLIRFDKQRVSDLDMIQRQIVSFWLQKERIPNILDELIDNISGFVPPKDPDSVESYTYKKTGNLSFELCAKFNLESKGAPGMEYNVLAPVGVYNAPGQDNWAHPAGDFCFSRSIDPELYRPKTKD